MAIGYSAESVLAVYLMVKATLIYALFSPTFCPDRPNSCCNPAFFIVKFRVGMGFRQWSSPMVFTINLQNRDKSVYGYLNQSLSTF